MPQLQPEQGYRIVSAKISRRSSHPGEIPGAVPSLQVPPSATRAGNAAVRATWARPREVACWLDAWRNWGSRITSAESAGTDWNVGVRLAEAVGSAFRLRPNVPRRPGIAPGSARGFHASTALARGHRDMLPAGRRVGPQRGSQSAARPAHGPFAPSGSPVGDDQDAGAGGDDRSSGPRRRVRRRRIFAGHLHSLPGSRYN